jgi:hypothetical protein
MTKIRRVSIRIQHREVTLSLTQTVHPNGEHRGESDGTGGVRPDVCPECGGPWMPDFQQELRQTRIGLEQLEAMIRNRRLHFHSQADGRFWVCQWSFHHMREIMP